jgi:hypothetical protein
VDGACPRIDLRNAFPLFSLAVDSMK